MGQQHPDRDQLTPGIAAAKFRDRGLYRHIEPQLALLMQHHRDGGSRNRFAHGGKIVDCALVHGLGAGVVGEVAHAGQGKQILALRDRQRRAREGLLRNALLEHVERPRKTLLLPAVGVFQ